jgi:hypothetical protein
MKIHAILTLLICIILVGCGMSRQTVTVKDATKSEVLILKKKPSQGAIHRIHFEGSGSIDGKAEIQLILDGAIYKKEEIIGHFSFDLESDWYSDEAEVLLRSAFRHRWRRHA